MKCDYKQNGNNLIKRKLITTLNGVHPEGGYIAWPNGKISRIKHDESIEQKKCVNRKGYVAWPVRD